MNILGILVLLTGVAFRDPGDDVDPNQIHGDYFVLFNVKFDSNDKMTACQVSSIRESAKGNYGRRVKRSLDLKFIDSACKYFGAGPMSFVGVPKNMFVCTLDLRRPTIAYCPQP